MWSIYDDDDDDANKLPDEKGNESSDTQSLIHATQKQHDSDITVQNISSDDVKSGEICLMGDSMARGNTSIEKLLIGGTMVFVNTAEVHSFKILHLKSSM